jgi:hypothetical protein
MSGSAHRHTGLTMRLQRAVFQAKVQGAQGDNYAGAGEQVWRPGTAILARMKVSEVLRLLQDDGSFSRGDQGKPPPVQTQLQNWTRNCSGQARGKSSDDLAPGTLNDEPVEPVEQLLHLAGRLAVHARECRIQLKHP